MIRFGGTLFFSISLAISLFGQSTLQSDFLQGKLAFLRDVQIWIADPDARNQTLLVTEEHEIEGFLFSPGLKLLAYAKIVAKRSAEAPDSNICSTIVYDLQKRAFIAELNSKGSPGDSVRPWRWFSDSRLILVKSSGFDVFGMDEFDVDSGVRNVLPGSYSFDTLVSGQRLWHTTDSGLGPAYRMTLFEKNLETGGEIELISKKSIHALSLSRKKEKLAFVEVDNAAGKDTIWVYDRGTESAQNVYTGEIGGKSEGFLNWSPDGQRIAVRYTNRPNIVIDTTQSAIQIPWRFATWLSNQDVLVGRGQEYRVFHLDTKKEGFLIRGISRPTLLVRR